MIGVDESPGDLAVARAYGEREEVSGLLDLRVGDLREPPVEERVPLVTIPFPLAPPHAGRGPRGAPRRCAPRRGCWSPAATSSSTCSYQRAWTSRRPTACGSSASRGIFERADWNERARKLVLSVRSSGPGGDDGAPLALPRRSGNALIEDAGLVVESLYGWFDRRPWDGGEDQIWMCSRSGNPQKRIPAA